MGSMTEALRWGWWSLWLCTCVDTVHAPWASQLITNTDNWHDDSGCPCVDTVLTPCGSQMMTCAVFDLSTFLAHEYGQSCLRLCSHTDHCPYGQHWDISLGEELCKEPPFADIRLWAGLWRPTSVKTWLKTPQIPSSFKTTSRKSRFYTINSFTYMH